MVRRCRLIVSPPVRRGRLGIALLLDPGAHVGEGELQVFAEAMRSRAESAGAPVVDGRDGHTQVRGDFAHVEQGLQTPAVLRGGGFAVHAEQVRALPRENRRQSARSVAYRNETAPKGRGEAIVMHTRSSYQQCGASTYISQRS